MDAVGERTVGVSIRVNGSDLRLSVKPRESLAEALRAKAGLTGTHLSCQIGVCGACTVLMDGDPVRACLVLAVQADGRDVVTVEGLEQDGLLTEVKAAMHQQHAVQCGFCTPGFVLLMHWLRLNSASMDASEIGEVLGSNLCRCTGYAGLIRAAEQVLGRKPERAG